MFIKLFARYRCVPRPIINLVVAQLLLNLVNSAFMLILNIYLRKLGYPDDQIAYFTSFRFLGVLLFAFPYGLFLKGKRLKPFFLAASLILPIMSVLLLEACRQQLIWLALIGFFFWGFGLMLINVGALPFIMRNADDTVLTESISLNYSTWSFGLIVSGFLISGLSHWGHFDLWGLNFPWDEYHILLFIVLMSFGSSLFFLRLSEVIPTGSEMQNKLSLKAIFAEYDWRLLSKALVPTVIIAVGAGLTIPFVNLFFYAVFNMDSDQFSVIGSVTAILVFFAALIVPALRRGVGYKIAIITTQSAAIFFLIILALTELISGYPGIIYLAILCYMLRQPLMNMAGPITNELTMKYVGEKNQELMSALGASIWSGSWFISAKLFQYFRSFEMPYYRIFLITAALYASGVIAYYFLIRDFYRKVDAGIIISDK